MKTLIVAEKPSVARDVAAVLGRFTKKDGWLENGQYVVSWALGHLVELAEPEDYDKSLKKWSLDTLPIIPQRFRIRPVEKTRKQLDILKRLLNSPEIGLVVNACDAGREGELIFRRVYAWCGCKKPVKRLWLSEATPAAVRKALSELRDGRYFDDLAAAAEARSQADWIVGMNATRAFTVRHGELLSVGRVQTPTLALIVAREREIREFVPQTYWEIWAIFQKTSGETYAGKWFKGDSDRLFDFKEAEAVVARAAGADAGRVVRVENKRVRELPPMLFNLNDLQKEANRRFGFTAQHVLDVAQALYEKHKLLTYPRTDSRHLTWAIARDTLASRLAAMAAAPEYAGLVPRDPAPLGKRYVDDARVTDHHAIIPTAIAPNLAALDQDARRIYDLVARRFLVAFYPEAVYAETLAVTEAGGETFFSKGRVELEPGWRMVYGREGVAESDDHALPSLVEGEPVSVEDVKPLEKRTKPPARFTEATLLAAMENAGRLVDDKDMADTLKSAGGIGTPATRASIIETLIRRAYIQRESKSLVPTGKGERLIDLVPEAVKSVELTARWEQGLMEIERGRMNAGQWLNGIKEFTKELVR
ncbi:DNA topoisomerase III [Desulfofundulus thermobenzoicus]|uniref:DNA topoisomerase n=1 Tax=Desulfofundulus thermobenzoicus TaxID=29376 RepID=A0A6N7IP85_9FIRM|nr:DNA topoisomerase III [Desulfofundulus thermobenzoicus]